MAVIKKKLHPFCADGYQYAIDIIDGKITANIYVISLCKQFLERFKRKDIYFNVEAAERFLKLGQQFHHVKGKDWKTPHLHFEPWQNFLFMNVYGWYSKETSNRLIRTSYCEVARGNGKSAIASIVGLYHLALEEPKGNEVYSAATGRDQARIILDSARAMAKANKGFLKATGTQVLAHQIVHEKSNSIFKALSSDSNTLDGLQPACALIDELHAHKDRRVYDVIESGMSKRRDSLMFMITTAGFSTDGIGYSTSAYAKKVALGSVQDDTFFPLIYTLDEKDNWREEEVWIKANPNMGVSVDPINFRAKAAKAFDNPADKNNFMVKHLNMWTNASSPFFNVDKWDLCKRDIKMEDFFGQRCYVGIDLASKVDFTSIAYVYKKDKNYYVFEKSHVPEQTVQESKNENYPKWVHDGYLIATQGEAINYERLEDDFLTDSSQVNILAAHFDPWNASEFAQRLSAKIEMVEFRMNVANLSEPMKMLDALIRENKIFHNGSPLVRWCLGNVVAKYDANDNVFPRKDHENLKIDVIVSIIMALAGWMQHENKESVYEERGIIVL